MRGHRGINFCDTHSRFHRQNVFLVTQPTAWNYSKKVLLTDNKLHDLEQQCLSLMKVSNHQKCIGFTAAMTLLPLHSSIYIQSRILLMNYCSGIMCFRNTHTKQFWVAEAGSFTGCISSLLPASKLVSNRPQHWPVWSSPVWSSPACSLVKLGTVKSSLIRPALQPGQAQSGSDWSNASCILAS